MRTATTRPRLALFVPLLLLAFAPGPARGLELLVTTNDDSVLRYDGSTGAFVDELVAASLPGSSSAPTATST
jgi:hypothetical protein